LEDVRRISNISVEDTRKRGRPKHRWVNAIRSDMNARKLNRKDTISKVR